MGVSLISLVIGQDTSLTEVKKAFDDANVRKFLS